jgi:RNA polymerase sigma-70 factor, ECF subfamily
MSSRSTPDDYHSESAAHGTVTAILHDVQSGDRERVDELFDVVYDELRQMAAHKLQFERDDHTLTPTALVHEAYLKLVDQRETAWQSRAHFYAVAAMAMRRVLVHYAEKRHAAKRGGGAASLSLNLILESEVPSHGEDLLEDILTLDEALRRLETFNPRGSTVIEQWFFGGLTQDEIAEVMGVSVVTVRRSWRAARAWLQREVRPQAPLARPAGDGPGIRQHDR